MIWVSWLYRQTHGREAVIAYALAMVVTLAIWAVIVMTGNAVKSMDEPDFLRISQNLVETGMFASEPGQPTAYRAPGLVFLLTPVSMIGADLMQARLVNGVLVGLTLILLFGLVRRHAGDLAALGSVAMVSAWPLVIYAASTLYPQTLAAFLLILTLWLLDRLRDGDTLRPAVLGGLAYGGLVLTVPVVLLLSPVFAAWIVAIARRWLSAVLVFAIVSAAATGVWTMRNWLTFDAFVPVASSSGYNLLAGNSPNTRWNTSLEVRFPEYVYTEMAGRNEIEQNDIMTRAALDQMAGDPGHYARLYLQKFVHWFHFSNRLLSDEVIETGASAVPVSTREIVLFTAWSVLIVGPLVLRIAMLRRVPPKRIEILFLALWIGAGLAYALFFTRVRFRLPFDWLVLSVNAMFIAALIEGRLGPPHRTQPRSGVPLSAK